MQEKKIIEYDAECEPCGGTGLYVGMGERNGSAVVCNKCNGSGKVHVRIEYNTFEKRKERKEIERVFEVNPGFVIGAGVVDGENITLEDFGGISYNDWKSGKKFERGSEMKKFTCPAWWYQSANYSLKPKWKECCGAGYGFASCPHFKNKHKCWEKFNKEYPVKQKGSPKGSENKPKIPVSAPTEKYVVDKGVYVAQLIEENEENG